MIPSLTLFLGQFFFLLQLFIYFVFGWIVLKILVYPLRLLWDSIFRLIQKH